MALVLALGAIKMRGYFWHPQLRWILGEESLTRNGPSLRLNPTLLPQAGWPWNGLDATCLRLQLRWAPTSRLHVSIPLLRPHQALQLACCLLFRLEISWPHTRPTYLRRHSSHPLIPIASLARCTAPLQRSPGQGSLCQMMQCALMGCMNTCGSYIRHGGG